MHAIIGHGHRKSAKTPASPLPSPPPHAPGGPARGRHGHPSGGCVPTTLPSSSCMGTLLWMTVQRCAEPYYRPPMRQIHTGCVAGCCQQNREISQPVSQAHCFMAGWGREQHGRANSFGPCYFGPQPVVIRACSQHSRPLSTGLPVMV